MSKKTKRIKDKDDYEESSFKNIVNDMEVTKNRALELVSKISKEQVPVERKHQTRYYMAIILSHRKYY